MKITRDHYDIIKAHIERIGLAKCDYDRCVETLKDTRVTDPEIRMRWNLFHAARLPEDVINNIYAYANDEHIDTALKKIVKETYGTC